MSVVMFDIDGVLADFKLGFAQEYERVHAQPFPLPPGEGMWGDFLDKLTWASVKNSLTFWQELPPLINGSEAQRIAMLTRKAAVYFVTARPGRSVAYQTEVWLYGLGIRSGAVILSSRKGEMCKALGADYAIDDKAGNCVYMAYESPRTHVYICDQSHNQFDPRVLGSKVKRVKTVSEFLDDVEGNHG
jgi:hypothetical protein